MAQSTLMMSSSRNRCDSLRDEIVLENAQNCSKFTPDEHIDVAHPPSTQSIIERANYHVTQRRDLGTAIRLVFSLQRSMTLTFSHSVFCHCYAVSPHASPPRGYKTRVDMWRHGRLPNCSSRMRPRNRCAHTIDTVSVTSSAFR